MKKAFIILSFFAVILLACHSNPTENNNCEQLDAIDKEMLDLYSKIESEYRSETEFLSKLNMSQVYWIQYRDRHLDALYPKKRKEYKKGDWSQFTDCECQEMVRLTKQRIEMLNIWLESVERYEDCPTSVKN